MGYNLLRQLEKLSRKTYQQHRKFEKHNEKQLFIFRLSLKLFTYSFITWTLIVSIKADCIAWF